MEKPEIRPPPPENAWTDGYQNWQEWLCPGYLPLCTITLRPIRGFCPPDICNVAYQMLSRLFWGAELYAITLAMYFVRRSRNSNFVIFSDSMSSLEALNGVKFELDLVQKIIKDYTHLTNNGKTIIFCWIPSHVNTPGNERKPTLQQSTVVFFIYILS